MKEQELAERRLLFWCILCTFIVFVYTSIYSIYSIVLRGSQFCESIKLSRVQNCEVETLNEVWDNIIVNDS